MTDMKTITGMRTTTGNGTRTADSRRSYRAVPSQRSTTVNLGPLQDLPGFWEGTGFSLTARPDFSGGNPDGLFLELNLLRETVEFTTIGSPVMNRGSVQGDIAMYGVTYLHRVTDGTTGEALHIEPGLWLNIPATTEPPADASVARLATIPHGTSFCAVGFAQDVVFDRLPDIPPANTVPFPTGSQPPPPGAKNPFPEYDLSVSSRFRTAPTPAGITQEVIADPHVLLREALREQAAGGHVLTRATWLITSTERAGGIGNIPFIVSNANTLSLESVFSVETVCSPSGTEYLQLGYSQTALLNFRGLSFPHVTVGTLIKAFLPAPSPMARRIRFGRRSLAGTPPGIGGDRETGQAFQLARAAICRASLTACCGVPSQGRP